MKFPMRASRRIALLTMFPAVILLLAAVIIAAPGPAGVAHAQAADSITGANLTISTTALGVNEGRSLTYTVSLNKSPAYPYGAVIVGLDVRDKQNSNITVSPTDHQFNYWNWSTPATFTVTANRDNNLTHGSATIKHTASIYDNDHSNSTTVQLADVTVAETDLPRCPTTTISANVATEEGTYRATGQRWEWEWSENWHERQSCASQNHELQPARYYHFSIPQNAARRDVTITLVADDADPELYLRTGNQRNGRQLAYNDDYRSNPNRSGNRWISRIRHNLGPGDYTIEAVYRLTANTQYLPAYSLTVDGLDTDTDTSPECNVNPLPMSSPEPGAPPPLLNAEMNATWDGSCDSTFTAFYGHSGTSNARWYKFQVKERGLYTIDLKSDSAHPWLHLRRGDSAKSGNYITRAEGGSGARIQRWLDPGWYTVEATNYHGGSTGPFNLTVKETRIRPGSAPSATGATLNLYGWDGAWHYRANTGPHTSCSGAQSGNSVTLTGLSEDATYTYTVYSDANCANAIASTSFIATASAGVAPGVILTDGNANVISSVSVPENGSATYQVRLSAAPSGGATTVTIAEGTTAPNNDTDITVSSPSDKTLTFATGNWWLAQTVTLSAADDIDKTSGSRDIGHTANGGGYSNVNGSLTAVEIEDDAAIVLSETAVTVPENGSATYTVKLTTPPTADVTVTIAGATTGNHTDANVRVSSPSNGTLNFTSQNYDTAQTVTLRAYSDSDKINGTRNITHTASGGNFDGAPVATVTATERDSQARVNVSSTTVTVTEEATATYNVTLNAQPAANVTVTIAEANTGNYTDGDITVTSSKALTFCPDASSCTSPNTVWSTAQTVTLSAAEDQDLSDGRRAITHTASDAGATHSGYDGAPVKSITAREDDIDTGGLTFDKSIVSVAEDGTGTYQVKLTHKPTGTVYVQVRAATGGSNDTDITVKDTNDSSSGNQTGSIQFSTDNWDTYRTVTLAARDDDDTDIGSRTINHTANGGGYSSITGSVTASEVENDATIVFSKSTVSVPEGSTATYTVKLGTAPTANVTVNLFAMPGSENDITIDSPSSEQLTFCPTTSNCASPNTVWSAAQTVTLAAAEDTANFGGEVNGSRRIRHRADSADTNYDDLTAFLTATEVENDKGILVPGFVDVPEGGSANFDVSLHVQPTHDVTITISENTTGWGIDPDITVTSPASKTLTFTSSNWNIGQTVTLSAAQDDDFDGGSRNINFSAASTDVGYQGTSATLFAIEAEDDVGIVLPATASVNEAGTGTYRVRLSAEPTGNVYVSVRAASGSGQDTDITIKDTDDSTDGDQTGSILFTADNWSTSRTVTLTARDDDDKVIGSRTINHSASGGQYGGITGTVTAEEAENDRAVVLSKSAVSVPEGSTATYTVKLNAAPSANVTVTIAEGTTAPNNDTDITVTGPLSKRLTFCRYSWGCTSPNTVWSTAQTVTLTADDDNDSTNGSRTINHTADSTDTNYDDLTASLTASEVENDLAVLIRNEDDTSTITSLNVDEGGSAKYKVKLSTQPTASVTVKLTAATGDSDITFSPSSMTFSTSSWNQLKTVTVRARQDNTDVIPGTKTITHTANGGDYVNVTATLTATEVEDDTLTLVFNPTDDVQVNEGGTGTYTLKLSHKPAANADIVIVCCSHNYDDGDLGIKDTDDSTPGDQPGGVTFTPDNWNIARTITLDADEDDDAKNGQAEVTHQINNTGPYYNITAHEVENDPGILIRNYADDSDLPSDGDSLPFLDVLEGSTERYKVKLATRPAGTVTVTIAEKTGGDSDITISSPSSKRLTFTTSNWHRGQTVTLRAAQDGGSAEGSRVIQHTASGGGYNISTPVELKAYEIDDEKAIIFCPASGDCYNNTITSIKVPEGRWADYKVKVSQDTLDHRGDDIFVTLTASGDRDITFDTDIYTEGIQTGSINLGNGNTETIRLYAARDNDRSNSVTNIKHTATSGGYEKLPATLKATEIDNVITLNADVAATAVELTISNFWPLDSVWHLKRTSPSAGDCERIVGIDARQRHDELSPGTAYTYKAYSDASCTQEIASGTFTTRRPSLNVSDVTHNSATLLLSNWDFDSGRPQSAYWGSSKSPGGTCYPSRDAYTVDLLSPNTSYTLTAYVENTCATEIGRKTVTTLAAASALHTVSNSSETQSSHFTVNLSDSYATSFTTGDEPGGYTLGNITITMSGGVSDPSKFAAKIYNNSSGKPGSLKTTLVGEAPVNNVAYSYHCISDCRLSANTTYHLALEVSEDGSFVRWPRTASDDQTVTSVNSGWTIGDVSSKATGGVWTASADTKSGRFSVRAAPVSPYMLPSSINGDSASLTVYGHTGNWYYKANKAPHNTCSTAQATDTASLTGLTAGTEYAYTAYRYSNCSTAIANVTFTTSAGLTEVHVTATTARLDLVGHSGAWWYDDTASAVSCTSVSSGTSPGRAKGLTKNTSYTFKAYSASGCANANLLAETTFTTKNPALASSNVTGTTAKLTLSNWATTNGQLGSSNSRDGYWYYQYTVPTSPAGVCTAGPTSPDDSSAYLVSSAELSGLSPGTAYTFKAYHDSSCTSSKEIATAASFTTDATLTVKDDTLTTTSATLVLDGNSAAWWLKKTAPTPAGSCESKQSSDTEVALSTLTLGTHYTYKAFSSSANCTSGTSEIASVSFITTTLAASSITPTGATLTINGHSGSWWYKANQGPHTTCQSGGSTSNNTDAETLSGLSAATEYTYTAYSASGCAAANLVATETFTTSGVSVSNLGNNNSNTLLIGRQFGSQVDSIAVAFTTGSESNGYTLSSVTASFGSKTGSPGNISAKIYSNSSGKPGSEVSSLTLSGTASPSNVDAVYTCSGTGCSLSASTTYHLVFSTTTTGMLQNYKWNRSALTSEVNSPSNAGWSIADSSSRKRDTNAWTTVSGNRPAKVKVVATVNSSSINALEPVSSVTANRENGGASGASGDGATGSQQSGSIVAGWGAATGATGYDVRYSSDGGATWTQAATSQSATAYTLANADDNSAYVVGVRAVNESSQSAWVNSNTVPAVAPADVGSPSLTVSDSGSASWTYTVPEGAEYVYTEIRWLETAGRETNDWSGKENQVFYDSSVAAHDIAGLTAGVEYKAKVFVGLKVDGENRYAKSNTVTFTPLVPPPASVSGVTASRQNGSIVAKWDAVTGATGYDVRYSTDDGSTWTQAATGQSATGYTLKDADNSLAYIVSVRAVNDSGQSDWTNSATVPAVAEQREPEPDPDPPASVSSVTASRENGGIKASWDAVDGATKYHVTYTTDGGSSWSLAAKEHATNSITIANAADDLPYIVGVRAGNSGGWSGWVNSDEVPAVESSPSNPEPDPDPPASVASVTASRENGSIKASWDAVDGATKYHITYSTDGGSSWSLAAKEHAANSITISNADDDLPYIVGVRAGNSGGWSGWVNSNEVPAEEATTQEPDPPASVSSVTASRENRSIKASWDAVDGATKYHITYSTDGGSSWSLAAKEHAANSITISNADDDLPYIVGVRAGNSGGWSGWVNSDEVPAEEATTQEPDPDPPASVGSVTASRENGGIKASWDAVDGATKYHITYSTDGGSSWSLAAKEHAANSITISNADDDLPYIVGVRAGNSGGWSGWVNSDEVPAEEATTQEAEDEAAPAGGA